MRLLFLGRFFLANGGKRRQTHFFSYTASDVSLLVLMCLTSCPTPNDCVVVIVPSPVSVKLTLGLRVTPGLQNFGQFGNFPYRTDALLAPKGNECSHSLSRTAFTQKSSGLSRTARRRRRVEIFAGERPEDRLSTGQNMMSGRKPQKTQSSLALPLESSALLSTGSNHQTRHALAAIAPCSKPESTREAQNSRDSEVLLQRQTFQLRSHLFFVVVHE